MLYLLSFFYPRRFDVAYINLKSAFPHKTPCEIKWLVRRSVFNLGLSLMEFVLSFKLDRRTLLKLVRTERMELLEEARREKKGIIFLTAHYDNWELLPMLGAEFGYPSYVIAREQKYLRLNRLLNRHRSKWGTVVVEKGLGLKKVLKALREKRCIGILADQNAGRNGVQVKLFNKYASTNPGFIQLAQATQAAVFPVFLKRIGLYTHLLKFHPRLELNRPAAEILQDYNQLLESYIRWSPQQWLWFHKRWKHSPNKTILVLSDAKPGHYKQSRVVAENLCQLLLDKISDEWKMRDENLIEVQEVEIGWKGRWRRNILYLLGLFSSKRCQGCLRCLRWALSSRSYHQLSTKKFDYIISAGSSLLPLNAILGYENNAVKIHILNPGRLYRNKFNLVFLPEHDSLRGRNVVHYKGALAKRNLKKATNFMKEGKIQLEQNALSLGILIGGGSKKYPISLSAIQKLFHFLNVWAQAQKIALLISTSRRTPAQIEKFLQDFSEVREEIKLLVIANRENPAGAYEAILSSGDIIIVTSDSISMLSEALEYGKEVWAYQAGRIAPKNLRFLNSLGREGLVKIISPEDLGENFRLERREKSLTLSNQDKVREGLLRVI